MSIVTLKKKTSHLYGTQSAGHTSFSINGTRRSQGWVGQTALSRSLPRTLARGNTLRGHGGLNGTYNNGNGYSITSGLVDWNDATVVKSPVLGTDGIIHNQFRWMYQRCSYSVTKPDAGLNTNTQGQHTNKISKCAINSDANGINNVIKETENFIQNGSFENPLLQQGNWANYDNFTQTEKNNFIWESYGNIEIFNSYIYNLPFPDSSQCVNGSGGKWIAQNFYVPISGNHKLSFYYSARNEYAFSNILVYVNDLLIQTLYDPLNYSWNYFSTIINLNNNTQNNLKILFEGGFSSGVDNVMLVYYDNPTRGCSATNAKYMATSYKNATTNGTKLCGVTKTADIHGVVLAEGVYAEKLGVKCSTTLDAVNSASTQRGPLPGN